MIIGNCVFADEALYDPESNTWVRFDDGGTATVGITSIFAWLTGSVTCVSFKEPGRVVERGKVLGSVEGPKHFDVVRSPLTGRVLSVNEQLAANPGLLNRDPYTAGWFAKLESTKQDELPALMSLEMAKESLLKKISDLRVRCFAEFPDHEMFEIGTECSAVLVRLDDYLFGSPMGSVVHLVSDDPGSEIEMIAWSERTGNRLLETRREGNLLHYIVKKA